MAVAVDVDEALIRADDPDEAARASYSAVEQFLVDDVRSLEEVGRRVER